MTTDPYDNSSLMEDRVLSSLRGAIGARLDGVSYACLENEAEPSDLHDAGFYFGGELVLQFRGAPPLILTWDEAAGWFTHFSIQARRDSSFAPGSLQVFDGDSVEVWAPLLESKLVRVRVLGFEKSPQLLELLFEAGTAAVAAGSQGAIGDGDDLCVLSGDCLASIARLQLLRSVGAEEET